MLTPCLSTKISRPASVYLLGPPPDPQFPVRRALLVPAPPSALQPHLHHCSCETSLHGSGLLATVFWTMSPRKAARDFFALAEEEVRGMKRTANPPSNGAGKKMVRSVLPRKRRTLFNTQIQNHAHATGSTGVSTNCRSADHFDPEQIKLSSPSTPVASSAAAVSTKTAGAKLSAFPALPRLSPLFTLALN